MPVISVQIAELEAVRTQALFRPVRGDLEPLTPGGRRVGQRAGETIVERLEHMGDFPVGGAVVTPGGDLAADFIIHLVVESREEPVTEIGVRNALTNGLRQACAWGVETVSVPPLGTGAGSLDVEGCARLIVPVLWEFVDSGESLREVIVVVGSEHEKRVFEDVLEAHDLLAVEDAAEVQGPEEGR